MDEGAFQKRLRGGEFQMRLRGNSKGEGERGNSKGGERGFQKGQRGGGGTRRERVHFERQREEEKCNMG